MKILQRTFIHSVSVERMLVFSAGPVFKEFISKIYFLGPFISIVSLKVYVIQICNTFCEHSSYMIPQSRQITLMLVVPEKCHEFPDAF